MRERERERERERMWHIERGENNLNELGGDLFWAIASSEGRKWNEKNKSMCKV